VEIGWRQKARARPLLPLREGHVPQGPAAEYPALWSKVAVRKKETLELKMPVGDSNEMAVTVRRGYNVLTIESVTESPRT
jgi:hypothetical protein